MRQDVVVRVHETWNGFRTAEVRLDSLRDVHWLQPDHAPHLMIHALVSCADVAGSQISHACDPVSAPHALVVCLLKRHVTSDVYAEIARRADGRTASGAAARQMTVPHA